jgi:hypothetical protein
MNERMGARPFVARTCVEYGELLLGGTAEDRARGLQLARRGLAEAEQIGLVKVRERGRRVLQEQAHAGAIASSR